ncbi:MAG: RNA ligase RtcB family protein [Desulfobacteraceae bacterium]|jgi:release factor H-coupled RctB family protein
MIQLLKSAHPIRLISSENTWIEGNAVTQLENTAQFEGIVAAAGMPDIHPGKGGPVGAAFLSKTLFYPHIIGNDAGCGMGFYQTTLKTKKMKKEKWAAGLPGFDDIRSEDTEQFLEDAGIQPGLCDEALGTIGGGNHFEELQMVEQVVDDALFQTMGCDRKTLFLLIHSGSRGLGEALYRGHTSRFGAKPLHDGTEESSLYLDKYIHAIKWAAVNRALIAKRFMEQTGGQCDPILDLYHNSITKMEIDGENYWLHRKGAAPSDAGPVIIPGSRGTLTYLVMPTGLQNENLWSVAHGAGRKWNRSSCRGKLERKWTLASLKRTDLGGIVICDDRDLLYEEAPQAYKKIETVIEAMVLHGLIKVIATFRPVITYKTGSI